MTRFTRLSIIAALLFLAIAARADAQSFAWRPLDGPYVGNVHFFVHAPGGAILAATDAGAFQSTDDGQTWHHYARPDGRLVIPYAVTPSGTVIAGTMGGTLRRSTDNGVTWLDASDGLPANSGGFVSAAPDGTLYMADGSMRGVFRSTSEGASWESIGLTGERLRMVLVGPDGTPFVMKDPKGLARYDRSGGTWETVATGAADQSFTALAFRSATEIYAGTEAGVYRSTDGGLSFQLHALPDMPIAPFSIHVGADGTVIAGITNDGVYRIDGVGSSAVKLGSGVPFSGLLAFTMTPPGNLIASYRENGVYTSSDTGRSWRRTGIAGMASVTGLALDGNALYVGTRANGIHKSTDNGATWTNLGLPHTSVRTIAIGVLGQVFVGGTNGRAYRSVDGGDNWTQLGAPAQGEYSSAIVLSTGTLLMAGSDGIARSTNNGQTWSEVGNFGIVSPFVRATNGTVWGIATTTSGSRVAHSTDDGVSWSLRPGPSAASALDRIAVANDNTVLLGVIEDDSVRVHRSTDNGSTWSPTRALCTGMMNEVSSDALGAYAVTDCGVFFSTNNGIDWLRIAPLPAGGAFGGLLVSRGMGTLYFGGEGVFTTTVESDIDDQASIEKTGALTVRPNPVGEYGALSVRMMRAGTASIELLDLLGNRVAMLFEGDLDAGEHLISLGLSTPLPVSGTYIIRLRAGDDSRSTIVSFVR